MEEDKEAERDPLLEALATLAPASLLVLSPERVRAALGVVARQALALKVRGLSDDEHLSAISVVANRWLRIGVRLKVDRTPAEARALIRRSIRNAHFDTLRKRRREEDAAARAYERRVESEPTEAELREEELELIEGVARLRDEVLPGLLADKHSGHEEGRTAFEDRVRIAFESATQESLAIAWLKANDPPPTAEKCRRRKQAQGKAQQRLFHAIFEFLPELDEADDPEGLRLKAAKHLKKAKSKPGTVYP